MRFLFLQSIHTGPRSHLSKGYEGRGHFPGVKLPGDEADHSYPHSVEVKNGGTIRPLIHMISRHNAIQIKHKKNITLLSLYFYYVASMGGVVNNEVK
jgi:hypothetical protein